MTHAKTFLESADWEGIETCVVALSSSGDYFEAPKSELQSAIKIYTDVATALAQHGRPVPNAEIEDWLAGSTFAISFRTATGAPKRILYYYGTLQRVQLIENGEDGSVNIKQAYAYDEVAQKVLSACYRQLYSMRPS